MTNAVLPTVRNLDALLPRSSIDNSRLQTTTKPLFRVQDEEIVAKRKVRTVGWMIKNSSKWLVNQNNNISGFGNIQ